VHTDGTLFVIDGDAAVVGLDPLTGAPKFSIPMTQSTSNGSPAQAPNIRRSLMIAGDGYAYLVYQYQVFSGDSSASHSELHARLLRVGSDGSSLEIPVGDWAMDQTHTRTGDSFNYETIDTQSGNVPVFVIPNLITNADQGVLLSLTVEMPDYNTYLDTSFTFVACPAVPCGEVSTTVAQNNQPGGVAIHLTTATGGSVTSDMIEPNGHINYVQPVLQAQDGTFFGLVDYDYSGDDFLASFDLSGNVQWSVPGYYAQIATSDGGVIAQSYAGQSFTFDQNGNSTGQLASSPTQSWLGNWYLDPSGTVSEISLADVLLAPTWAAALAGNLSRNNSAAVRYEPPRDALRTIASTNLTAQAACSTFLDNLTTIAIGNGRDSNGSNLTKLGLVAEIQSTASQAANYVYDGPISNTVWQQCTQAGCVAMFPVWFTGENQPVGYLVKQEFLDNGPGTFHYLEALSQYDGAAIWLRLFDDWDGAWKGLTSQYITTFSLSKAGQVNGYGLGTLTHEVLHKRTVGGGFTHADMSTALGISSCTTGGTQNGCSSAIAARCFPSN